MKRPVICIDPGHGDHDSGAVGPTGLREKDVVLDVCLMLADLLKPTCDVVLTRESDTFLPLTSRAKIANQAKADLFLSVHCNAGPPGQGEGFEVWTSPGQTASDPQATILFNNYADRFPLKSRRIDMSDGDVDKESKFTVLMKTAGPAVLFELEFVHTREGEAWLKQEENRQACAEALADGVFEICGIERDETPEETSPEESPTPPAIDPDADLANAWEWIVTAGNMNQEIEDMDNASLIDLRRYLHGLDPSAVVCLGIALVENQMITRFELQNL